MQFRCLCQCLLQGLTGGGGMIADMIWYGSYRLSAIMTPRVGAELVKRHNRSSSRGYNLCVCRHLVCSSRVPLDLKKTKQKNAKWVNSWHPLLTSICVGLKTYQLSHFKAPKLELKVTINWKAVVTWSNLSQLYLHNMLKNYSKIQIKPKSHNYNNVRPPVNWKKKPFCAQLLPLTSHLSGPFKRPQSPNLHELPLVPDHCCQRLERTEKTLWAGTIFFSLRHRLTFPGDLQLLYEPLTNHTFSVQSSSFDQSHPDLYLHIYKVR